MIDADRIGIKLKGWFNGIPSDKVEDFRWFVDYSYIGTDSKWVDDKDIKSDPFIILWEVYWKIRNEDHE